MDAAGQRESWEIFDYASPSTINYYLLLYRNKTVAATYPQLTAARDECRHAAGGSFIQNNRERGCLVTPNAVPRLTIPSLANGAEYAVKIVAVNARGAGDFIGGRRRDSTLGRTNNNALEVDGAKNFIGEQSALVGGAPATPANLELSATALSFTASWGAVSGLPLGDPAHGGFAISKYILVYKNVSDIGHDYPALVVSGANYSCPGTANTADSGCSAISSGDPVANTVTVSGLTNGLKYRARVLALNQRGASAFSAEAQVMPASNLASAPRSVTLSPAIDSLSLQWSAPAANGGSPITGYLILYKSQTTPYPALSRDDCTGITNDPNSGCVLETGLTHALSSMTNGVSYDIRLRAVTANGLGAAVSLSAAPGAVPDAVVAADIRLSPQDRGVSVRWNAANANYYPIQKYLLVYRRGSNSYRAPAAPLWECPSTPANDADDGCIEISGATQAALNALQNGQRYQLRLAAVNALGRGAYSDEREFVPNQVPSAPRQMRLYGGNGGLSAAWNAPAAGAPVVNYLLVYRRAGAAAYTMLNGDGSGCAAGSPTADQGCFTTANAVTSLDLRGLSNGTAYTVRVRAISVVGVGAWSSEASATPNAAAASAVQNLRLRALPRRLHVEWTPPLSNGDSPITGYIVLYKSGIGTFPLLVNNDCSGVSNSFVSGCQTVAATARNLELTSINLSQAVNYNVMARAITASGLGTARVGSVTALALPGRIAAASFNLSAQDRALSVAWQAPASNAAGITRYILIYRNVTDDADYPQLRGDQEECRNSHGAQVLQTSVNGCLAVTAAPQAVISGLRQGAEYAARVAAVNVQGRAPFTVEKTASVGAVPAPPLISALQRVNNGLRVTWAAPIQNGGAAITRYIILYRKDANAYPSLTAAATCGGFTNTSARGCARLNTPANLEYTFNALSNTGSYHVTLHAVNAFGASARVTNSWTAAPPTPPDVTNLQLFARSNTEFRAEWDSPSAAFGVSVTRYILLYKNVTQAQDYPALSGTGALTNCATMLPSGPNNGCQTTTTQIDPSITLTGLNTGDNYAVKVAAVNTFGVGNDSAERQIVVAAPNSVRAPDAIADASFTLELTNNAASFTAAWTAPANNGSAITKYILVYRDLATSPNYPVLRGSGSSSACPLAAADPNDMDAGCIEVTGAAAVTVSSLRERNARYGVKILTLNAEGASPYTQTKNIRMGTAPAVVQDVIVTHGAAGVIVLNWSALSASAATGGLPIQYIVEYRELGSSAWTEHARQAQVGSSISGLNPLRTYELRVYAVNAVTNIAAVLASVQAAAAPVTRLGAPANLRNTLTNSGNNGNISLSWGASAGSARYDLEESRSADAGTSWEPYSALLRATQRQPVRI